MVSARFFVRHVRFRGQILFDVEQDLFRPPGMDRFQFCHKNA